MHRYLDLLILMMVAVAVVYGQEPHSNYGDEKKNKQHIEEHMKSMNQEAAPEPSEQDMIYYLFVIHDVNGDGYLDGHELRAAFTDYEHEEQEKELSLKEVTDIVDHVLLEDDKNGDGLISWSEYLESQLYHEN